MTERKTLLQNVAEARKNGARLSEAAAVLGVDARTLQRWEKDPREDGRRTNRFAVTNALSPDEERRVIDTACSPKFRDMSPNQIVPILAERGEYVASEATFHRVLRRFGLLTHRSKARAPERKRPDEITATGPNQVWTWDISYLLTGVRGVYFYLYLIIDIWDRSIVGWAVHEKEDGLLAADLLETACLRHGVERGRLTVHQDNGGPMLSLDYLAALSRWGRPSYSRPGVSDDNPYSESQFRTLKYRPDFPERFETLEAAVAWIESYVEWYHSVHRHSGIGFVTPLQRRSGADIAILEKRRLTYELARERHPSRWSRGTRKWDRPGEVTLNPRKRREKGKNARQGKAA